MPTNTHFIPKRAEARKRQILKQEIEIQVKASERLIDARLNKLEKPDTIGGR